MTSYDTEELVMRTAAQPAHAIAQSPQPSQTAFSTRRADAEGLPRRTADAVSVSPAAMARMAADLSTLVEQGRQNTNRLNEELGALGMQLRQQHMDVSDRIMSLQAGIGSQFDAVAAAIAASASQMSRVSDAVAQRQQAMVVDMVQKELALQLLPLQARARVTNALCGASVALSIGLLTLAWLA